ncbi:hypothetical protein BGW42_001006 [Actinomortierella wolfii]|nr:hypothetical protein BGW42_001006 [Actinomortierella wolfii]KAG0241248.1 hypothetical protein BGW41_006102 [Actinomortierella wolfii]
MVKLRVSAGGNYTDLKVVGCNDELHPVEFETENFKGRAMVRIKDFVGITPDGSAPIYNSDYFKGHNRRFSIQVEGRFKREWDGNQVYFGTDFDRSVKLPSGFEIMFNVAKYIDPVVKTSISEEGQPWILSPLVSSINSMSAWRPQDAIFPSPPLTPRQSVEFSNGVPPPEQPSYQSSMWGLFGKFKKSNRHSMINLHTSSGSSTPVHKSSSMPYQGNNISDTQLPLSSSATRSMSVMNSASTSPNSGSMEFSNDRDEARVTEKTREIEDAEQKGEFPLGHWRQNIEEDTTFFLSDQKSLSTAQRRKYFQSEDNRDAFVFKPEYVHGFEFFSPHMDFNTFDIRLGLSMNIRKYLNDQPVRYTCRTLDGSTVFWAVQFELVDD